MSMHFEIGNCYHIYNRGNNRQQVFFEEGHYNFFLKKFRSYCLPYCKVIAYCLMPNHFHFMIYIPQIPISELAKLNGSIGTLLSSYTQAINKQRGRTGSLFQSSTKAKKILSEDHIYPLTCIHYIHQNPLRARLVDKPEDWPFSSYREFANLRNGTLPDKDFVFQWLNFKDETEFIQASLQSLNPDIIKKLY